MTRYRFATLSLLLAGAAAIAADPAPPVIVLPPGELVPQIVLAADDAATERVDWSVTYLNAPEAWKKTKGKGTKVAVLDTGIDGEHQDLKAAIVGVKDFTGSRSGTADVQGHGSHVAGSIGARENGWGLVGCAPECSLLVGKVLGDSGSGSVDGIAKGIDWSVEQGADVISMSLGGPGRDSWIPPALRRAEAAGVIVIAAAGNEGPREGTVGYPGGYAECIAVGAVDRASAVAGFSSRGPAVYVAGPGVNVLSTYPGNRTATMSGTSMATPNIAGIAALWVAAHPEIAKKDRPAAFRKALQAACRDLPPVGRDSATGFGVPDAAKLVAGGTTPPAPLPEPPLAPVVIELKPGTVVPDGLTVRIEYQHPRPSTPKTGTDVPRPANPPQPMPGPGPAVPVPPPPAYVPGGPSRWILSNGQWVPVTVAPVCPDGKCPLK